MLIYGFLRQSALLFWFIPSITAASHRWMDWRPIWGPSLQGPQLLQDSPSLPILTVFRARLHVRPPHKHFHSLFQFLLSLLYYYIILYLLCNCTVFTFSARFRLSFSRSTLSREGGVGGWGGVVVYICLCMSWRLISKTVISILLCSRHVCPG